MRRNQCTVSSVPKTCRHVFDRLLGMFLAFSSTDCAEWNGAAKPEGGTKARSAQAPVCEPWSLVAACGEPRFAKPKESHLPSVQSGGTP